MIRLISTVRVPKSLIILAAVANAAELLNIKLVVVTSGNDGQHMPASKHYTNDALDFRTRHIERGLKLKLKTDALQRLGAGYQAILEDVEGDNEHLHIEYDPT